MRDQRKQAGSLRYVFWLGVFAVGCMFGNGESLRAEVPGGPMLPMDNDQPYAAHGQARIGYYLGTRTYRFQGRYGLTYNVGALGPNSFYLMADVDVEALSNVYRNFLPDRLQGTFEIGARHFLGVHPLSVYIRHSSPHNVDVAREARRQGSWEMLGVRWRLPLYGSGLNISVGKYVHPIFFDYLWDLDVQGTWAMGTLLRKPLSLYLDFHAIPESGRRSGIVDFWIEPQARVSDHLAAYLGFGHVDDTDVFMGKSDTPVQVGIKIMW